MEKRWVVRRSEPVKEVLLMEGKVYPGGTQGTIGLRIQNRSNSEKYRRTRTGPKTGTKGWANPSRMQKTLFPVIPLTITKHRYLHQNIGWRVGTCRDQFVQTRADQMTFSGVGGATRGCFARGRREGFGALRDGGWENGRAERRTAARDGPVLQPASSLFSDIGVGHTVGLIAQGNLQSDEAIATLAKQLE